MYNELLEYVKINKHCNIPCSKGKLGRWAATQRTSYRKTSISSERIKLLEDIGFVWNIEEVRWQEMYNKLLEYKKSNNHCEFSIKEEKLDKWVSRQRESFNNNKLSAERIKLLEDIGFIWNPFESEWQEMYNELLEYKESNGHCDMPKREGKLGLWISTQRINYKNNILSTERIKLLEEIGFKWNIEEAKWQDMYSKLLEYKKTNGHCNVPLKTFKLGRWISTQRKKYKDNTLSDERIKLLEDAGFIWSVEESRWQEMYSELLEYKKSNNNCNVPNKGSKLGIWVANQRTNYKNNTISTNRIELLEELGFIWDVKEAEWQTMYNELVEYKKVNGHCNVPKRESKLGPWAGTQRANYKNNKLDIDKIKLLEEIGFIWDVNKTEWQTMYNELVEYKKVNSHCNVPRSEGKLGIWARTQRKAYKNNKLDNDKIKLLDEIGFIWNPYETEWQTMYNELVEYKKVNGNCNVPARVDKLGTWVGVQRTAYKNNTISTDRIELLEELGFIWDVKEAEWQTMYNELVEYKKVNGHCNVPKRESKLGLWVGTQRKAYKNNTISTNRIKLLEGLGFIWNLKTN